MTSSVPENLCDEWRVIHTIYHELIVPNAQQDWKVIKYLNLSSNNMLFPTACISETKSQLALFTFGNLYLMVGGVVLLFLSETPMM